METAATIILVLFVLVGVVANFLAPFGNVFIFIGAALFAWMTHFQVLGLGHLGVLFALYLLGEGLEYLLTLYGAKRMGATNLAAFAGIIGGIAGALAGAVWLGAGALPGLLIGIFLGAALAEYALRRDLRRSLKAGTGALLGRLGSIALKFVIAVAMILVLLKPILASR